MAVVEKVRSALLQVLQIEKVYLMYLDEAHHVHWHLVPRYDEQGYNMLCHKPGRLRDTALARRLEKIL